MGTGVTKQKSTLERELLKFIRATCLSAEPCGLRTQPPLRSLTAPEIRKIRDGNGCDKTEEPPRKGLLKSYPGNVLISRTLAGQGRNRR